MKSLNFNQTLYKKTAIQKAISAYSNFARLSLSQDKRYFKVKIKKIAPGLEGVIADEFANYVLGETKKCL